MTNYDDSSENYCSWNLMHPPQAILFPYRTWITRRFTMPCLNQHSCLTEGKFVIMRLFWKSDFMWKRSERGFPEVLCWEVGLLLWLRRYKKYFSQISICPLWIFAILWAISFSIWGIIHFFSVYLRGFNCSILITSTVNPDFKSYAYIYRIYKIVDLQNPKNSIRL